MASHLPSAEIDAPTKFADSGVKVEPSVTPPDGSREQRRRDVEERILRLADPGAYDRLLYDAASGKTWDQMTTDAERVASSPTGAPSATGLVTPPSRAPPSI